MSTIRYCTFLSSKEGMCWEEGGEPKFTKKLADSTGEEGDRQPVWRCKRHWRKEPEIGAISGQVIVRPYPGRGW
jgi:hypothetical protein